MLKLFDLAFVDCLGYQPPSGGCVLKPIAANAQINFFCQPPSGGCVLKPCAPVYLNRGSLTPAAFGRLCVETQELINKIASGEPAAFGRLCVETIDLFKSAMNLTQPPSGGCVLKLQKAWTQRE